MKKFIFSLSILLLATNVFATQNVFYCKEKELKITDISGIKTEEQIRKEFDILPDQNLEKIIIDENRYATRIEGTKLVKYDYKLERTEKLAQKKKEKELEEQSVKGKLKILGLNDKEIEILVNKL